MGLIELYVIFALSTSVACWYLFYVPAVRAIKELNIENNFTKHYLLSSTIYVVISTVIAPALVIPMLSTSAGERFFVALLKTMAETD